jgi:hypothetical protein
MAERVQVILKPEEKVRLQRQAEREGSSLSAWLRQVALERLAERAAKGRFRTSSELREFFERCSAQEQEREPDWEVQRSVIDVSRRSGSSNT